jgi:3-hydroxybutyryl-CoA dehydratase
MSNDLLFEHIEVGSSAEFERSFTTQDVEEFARLSGDFNPLHMDESYAASTKFKQRVVHGMLVASLTSALLGMHLPGKRCLYLGGKVSFKLPVFIGDILVVRGEVTHTSAATRILTVAITISRGTETVLSGEALAQVLE